MSFAPGRVVHFGHDGFHVLIVLVKTIIEADRIENMTEIAEVCQQADRPLRRLPGFPLHEFADGIGERLFRIPQVIFAAKPCQGRSPGGPEPAAFEQTGQFVQVEVHHEQAVAEPVRHRRHAAMPKPS